MNLVFKGWFLLIYFIITMLAAFAIFFIAHEGYHYISLQPFSKNVCFGPDKTGLSRVRLEWPGDVDVAISPMIEQNELWAFRIGLAAAMLLIVISVMNFRLFKDELRLEFRY